MSNLIQGGFNINIVPVSIIVEFQMFETTGHFYVIYSDEKRQDSLLLILGQGI